jgi:hypothetical protein
MALHRGPQTGNSDFLENNTSNYFECIGIIAVNTLNPH